HHGAPPEIHLRPELYGSHAGPVFILFSLLHFLDAGRHTGGMARGQEDDGNWFIHDVSGGILVHWSGSRRFVSFVLNSADYCRSGYHGPAGFSQSVCDGSRAGGDSVQPAEFGTSVQCTRHNHWAVFRQPGDSQCRPQSNGRNPQDDSIRSAFLSPTRGSFGEVALSGDRNNPSGARFIPASDEITDDRIRIVGSLIDTGQTLHLEFPQSGA